MTVSRPTLDAGQLRELLTRLGALATDRGVELDLVALGGAVIALLFESRRTTRDIDLVEIYPSREFVTDLAAQVSRENGLSPRWLSDEAARFARSVSRGRLLFEAPGIRLYAVTHEQLLASKLDAMRDDVDRADAVVVASALGLTRSSTEPAIAPYIQPERYARACQELNDIWAEVEDARR
jgi:hypothetical protein